MPLLLTRLSLCEEVEQWLQLCHLEAVTLLQLLTRLTLCEEVEQWLQLCHLEAVSLLLLVLVEGASSPHQTQRCHLK